MNNKRLLSISWFLLAFFIIGTIGSYIWVFNHRTISESPEQWGQFGDYLGGVLNPIISLANLVVLTYITLALSKIEDKRNEFTLQELARPLANIICGDYETKIEVKVKNCGMGPLRVKKIVVKNTNGTISNTLIEQMPNNPDGVFWQDFVIDGRDFVIAKDDYVNLIKIEYPHDHAAFANYRAQLRQALSALTIEIEYVDIYNRPMEKAIRNLELFRRTLRE